MQIVKYLIVIILGALATFIGKGTFFDTEATEATEVAAEKPAKKTKSAKPVSSAKTSSSSKTDASSKQQNTFDFTPKMKADGIRLERTAYTLLYNKELRLPLWVAWHLTKNHTTGNNKREGLKFMEDEDVPTPRATNMDYVNSGYDRGHMCPSGDNKWSEKAQLESFLYTNCCPQLHTLNAGDWEELESKCRYWARKYGDIYIVCGPVLMNKKHKTIGKSKVVVPEAFYKVVLCMQGTPKGIGFIYRNNLSNKKMSSYVNTIDDVERITGIDFFPALPDNIEKKVEATVNLSDWAISE